MATGICCREIDEFHGSSDKCKWRGCISVGIWSGGSGYFEYQWQPPYLSFSFNRYKWSIRASIVTKLEDLARLKDSEKIINVVARSQPLSDYDDCHYFTTAFPTLFPYGTGKHIDERRRRSIGLTRWIQLLLRHSSRYSVLSTLILMQFIRRFQAH